MQGASSSWPDRGNPRSRSRSQPRRDVAASIVDLTNLSPATSIVTRLLKPKAKRRSLDSSASSIGSSTVPRIPTLSVSISVPIVLI
ncbi:hypothetical protein VPH35_124967 [Triticum aestivum]